MRILAIVTLLIVLVVVASSVPTAAQTTKPKCDPAAVIAKANALKSGGDAKKDVQALVALQAEISQLNLMCNGMVLSGKTSKVLDPITLPSATYRVKVTNKKVLVIGSVISTTLSGECGVAGVIMAIQTDQREMEGVIESKDCRMVIDIKNLSDWTIGFEPLE
jgi:hypothetical protein